MEQVVFSQSVEALFKHGIPRQVTPELKNKLRGIGIDLDRPLEPAYPRQVWVEALAITRRELFPGLDENLGYFEIGQSIVTGFTETPIGRALAVMARVLGPKRMLARMTQNLRASSNFNETRVTELADGSYELWVNEGLISPYYMAGLLDAGLRLAGSKDGSVTLRQHTPEGATYAIRLQAG